MRLDIRSPGRTVIHLELFGGAVLTPWTTPFLKAPAFSPIRSLGDAWASLLSLFSSTLSPSNIHGHCSENKTKLRCIILCFRGHVLYLWHKAIQSSFKPGQY